MCYEPRPLCPMLHAKGHHHNDLPLAHHRPPYASVTVYWYDHYCSSVSLEPFTAQMSAMLLYKLPNYICLVSCLLQLCHEVAM